MESLWSRCNDIATEMPFIVQPRLDNLYATTYDMVGMLRFVILDFISCNIKILIQCRCVYDKRVDNEKLV